MIVGHTRSALLGCRLARACVCFQPVARAKNREGRPASSTGKAVPVRARARRRRMVPALLEANCSPSQRGHLTPLALPRKEDRGDQDHARRQEKTKQSQFRVTHRESMGCARARNSTRDTRRPRSTGKLPDDSASRFVETVICFSRTSRFFRLAKGSPT